MQLIQREHAHALFLQLILQKHLHCGLDDLRQEYILVQRPLRIPVEHLYQLQYPLRNEVVRVVLVQLQLVYGRKLCLGVLGT